MINNIGNQQQVGIVPAQIISQQVVNKDDSQVQDQPKDSFLRTVGKEIKFNTLKYGRETGSAAENSLGGLTGIVATGILGGVGAVGGTMLMGAVGLASFGPLVGALATKGIGGLLGTAFAVGGGFAKVGLVGGAITGITSGWMGLRKLTGSIANVAGSVVGGAVGVGIGLAKGVKKGITGEKANEYAKPVEQHSGNDENSGVETIPSVKKKDGFLKSSAKAILGGVGMGSMAIGGAATGALITGAGVTLSGLAAGGLTLAAVAGAVGTGGIAGAVIGGVLGAYGGWKILDGIRSAGKKVVDMTMNTLKFTKLQKKEELLEKQKARIESLSGEQKDIIDNRIPGYVDTKTGELKKQNSDLDGVEKEIAYVTANKDKIIKENSEQMYREETARLDDREKGQIKWEVSLDERERVVSDKEANVEKYVEKDAQSMYDRRESQLKSDYDNKSTRYESDYQNRKGNLESYDRELQQRRANIPNEVNQKVADRIRPLENELEKRIEHAKDLDFQSANKRANAQNMRNESYNLNNQANSIQGQADSERRMYESERYEVSSLENQVNNQKSVVNQLSSEAIRLQQAIQQAQANKS